MQESERTGKDPKRWKVTGWNSEEFSSSFAEQWRARILRSLL